MTTPIKKGDLVVIVKAAICSKSTKLVGHHFVVHKIVNNYRVRCSICKQLHTVTAVFKKGVGGVDLRRLKKIPPLSELQEVIASKEVTVK